MTDKEEMVISPEFISYERIRAIKEAMVCVLDGATYDSIKLVGLSLIFVDTNSDVRMEHKEKVAWFDETQYGDDYCDYDEAEE